MIRWFLSLPWWRFAHARYRFAAVAVAALLAVALSSYWVPGLGLSLVIRFGDQFQSSTVPAFTEVPLAVMQDSWGYDGQFYAQIATSPLLTDPALPAAIDTLDYRARRIFLPAVAYAVGLGQPPWILHAYAGLNLACWLALAWLLTRWLPLDSLPNFLRWLGVVLAAGTVHSMTHALTDLPALLLLAVGVALWERHRRTGGALALAAAVLTKETSLLAGTLLLERWPRRWSEVFRLAGLALLVVAPLALWLAWLQVRVGHGSAAGTGTFAAPFTAVARVAGELWTAPWTGPGSALAWEKRLMLAGLLVQAGWLVLRPCPGSPWWRIGAPFVGLLVVVGYAVAEGYPSATARAFLPIALAFNLLVPGTWRMVPLLVLGNLGVAAGVMALPAPPDAARLRDEVSFVAPALASLARMEPGAGWHALEELRGSRWWWAPGPAEWRAEARANWTGPVVLRGELRSVEPRRVLLYHPGGVLAVDLPAHRPVRVETPPFVLGAELVVLRFAPAGEPWREPGPDGRALSFAFMNPELAPAPR